MAEDIKGLIEKIQQEGVAAAQEKARQIEEEARQGASAIIEKARKNADKLLAGAKDEIARSQQSVKVSLQQSGRDLVLTVKKEIAAMLDRLIMSRTREALNAGEMSEIITTLVKNYSAKDKEEIIILLNKQDLKKLKEGLIGELKGFLKKGITIKPSEDITGGFVISFDSGKSHFDFTDTAIAEYIGTYLKPKLAEILKSSSGK